MINLNNTLEDNDISEEEELELTLEKRQEEAEQRDRDISDDMDY